MQSAPSFLPSAATSEKTATASSALPDHPAALACDNTVKTWWSAETGDPGEWLCIDLGAPKTVHAVQTNFADQDFGIGPEPKSAYSYTLEYSRDGKRWTVLKRESGTHRPHQLIVPKRAVKARYVRLRNEAPLTGKLSVFDLRVFGFGPAPKPEAVTGMTVERAADPRRITVRWNPSENADGYVLHWGVREDELYSSCEVYDSEVELGLFSVGEDYWFRVDAFNEGGVTPGQETIRTTSR